MQIEFGNQDSSANSGTHSKIIYLLSRREISSTRSLGDKPAQRNIQSLPKLNKLLRHNRNPLNHIKHDEIK
jgi:hypothetical protein